MLCLYESTFISTASTVLALFTSTDIKNSELHLFLQIMCDFLKIYIYYIFYIILNVVLTPGDI